MDDGEFFDTLYQLWAKTTEAEKSYWMPEEYEDHSGRFRLYAVNQEDDKRKLVASSLSDQDADFISGIHGAIPELVRLLHVSIDEAARLDEARDQAEAQLADALLENIGLQAEIHELERLIG